MASHTSDWHPGRVSSDFREGWDRIFGGKTDDDEQVKEALKYFKQDCCAGSCDCSMRKPS
jgi:hypothetical protein